jgi:hypothetical protein
MVPMLQCGLLLSKCSFAIFSSSSAEGLSLQVQGITGDSRNPESIGSGTLRNWTTNLVNEDFFSSVFSSIFCENAKKWTYSHYKERHRNAPRRFFARQH